MFERSFGNDIIDNYDRAKLRSDSVKFGSSIRQDELKFSQIKGNDLLIYFKDELAAVGSLASLTNSITIKNFFRLEAQTKPTTL